MNKHLRFIYIFLLLSSLSISFVKAQTNFASEDELKKQAAKLFEEEEYEKATPLYSQLVSNYLKDPNYNYRLGVCLLFTNADKEKAISYLEFAANKTDVEKEAHYYLGLAYHLNYRFDDALSQYQAYMRLGQAKNIEKFQVQRQMEMCVNGKKLLQNLSDLQVTEKKEMNKEDFFRSYDISTIGGKLLVKPEEKEFKTAIDKKKKEQSIIYLAKDKSQVYFSSYGLEGNTGKDIYVTKKLPSGEWAKSQLVGSFVNTKYDEDFPFLHPNGKALYFSSKGHNSMGGYDIFKSIFNELTQSWGPPQNMDFPINTPDDDILYVTDSSEKEAYFSSARGSASGKISVYHINVDRKPLDVVIIKGNVIKNRNNQALDLKITVKDLATNNILGMYNSSPENGAYSLELPNGGSFSFTVESSGFPTQSDVVIIPVQYKFTPMKQEISYDLVTSRLKITNSFGGTNEDENYLLALNYIKNKSKMDVSLVDLSPIEPIKSDADVDSADIAVGSSVADPNKKLSNEDIIKIAYEDAKDVDAEAKELREQADIALNLANQKNELAQTKTKEASSYMAEAQNTSDITKKEEFFDKSDAASTEAKKLNQETVIAYNIAKKLDATAFKKQEEADVSQQYAKELELAVQQGSTPQALAKVEVQEKKLEELSKANEGVSSISNNLKVESDTKQRELNKAIQTSNDIKQEMLDNETMVTNLKADLAASKNEELKQGIDNQIAELNQENEYKKTELKKNDEKVAKLQNEYEVISNETAMVNAVINQSKTESSESASAGVATIDKGKLEQQVNNIAGVAPTSSAIKSTATLSTIPDKATLKSEITTASTSNSVSTTTGKPTPITTKPENTKPETPAITSTTSTVTVSTDSPVPVITKPETPVVASATSTVTAAPDKVVPIVTKAETPAIVSTTSTVTASSDKPMDVLITKPEITNTVTSTSDPVATTQDKSKLLTEPTVVVADTPKITNEVLIALNKKNEPELAAAEKIPNTVDREIAKAKILQNWANEIESNRVKLQAEYDTTSDFAQKVIIEEKINDLKVGSKEKQAMAKESLATIDSIKQQKPTFAASVNDPAAPINNATTTTIGNSASTTNTTNSNITASTITAPGTSNVAVTADKSSLTTTPTIITTSTTTTTPTTTSPATVATATKNDAPQLASKGIDEELEKINKGNEADMAVVEKIENKKDRDKARAGALQMWAEEVEAHTAQLQKKYMNTTDTAKKNLLAKQIAASKKSVLEKTGIPTASTEQQAIASNTTTNTRPIVLLPEEAFERKSVPVYSKEKPIPLNDKLPEGIIYKVQIGAFRNPIAQDLFKGMSPITGETTPQGFIRYTAGIFKNRATAENIKNEIKNLGYKDAFVVAFKDGKRISMKEADIISGEKLNGEAIVQSPITTQEDSPIAVNTGTTPLTVKQLQSMYTDIIPARSEAKLVATEQPKDAAPTENVTTVGGLFYTIQVGVFAQAVPASKLYNIQPLYTEAAPNGNLRYNVGIYNNLARASEAKSMAIDIGIKDAFITAYYNGKRISVTEAKQYEYDGGVKVFSTAPNVNALPYFGKEQKQSATQTQTQTVPVNKATNEEQPSQKSIPEEKATEENMPVVTKKSDAPLTIKELQNLYTDIIKPSDANSPIRASTFEADVVFKVQIGAFRNEVPLDIVNNFLKISKYGVENYVDINNMTIYTAGDFKTYEEANKLKAELASDVFKDAFVVAYRKGKKISLEEARGK